MLKSHSEERQVIHNEAEIKGKNGLMSLFYFSLPPIHPNKMLLGLVLQKYPPFLYFLSPYPHPFKSRENLENFFEFEAGERGACETIL